MTERHYATPLWVSDIGDVQVLERLPISSGGSTYNEAFIQDLAFKYPDCLPVTEIDRVYEGLIPICRELNTRVGTLDVLYVASKGRLAVVEAKLWRNPEARRKVVGQILDYAKELARLSYEDLQREVSRSTGRKGKHECRARQGKVRSRSGRETGLGHAGPGPASGIPVRNAG